MKNLLIDMRDAEVAYNGNLALAGVSLQVLSGECVVLLGPNGAGKTTLLTAINGFAPLTSGTLTVLGRQIRGREVTALRKRIGYVAQSQPVDPRMPITLRESVTMGLYGRLGWRGRLSDALRNDVEAAMRTLGVLSLANRPLGHLSGGEMRRAMIARALLQKPELLLLDEPTASLDERARRDILVLMTKLHQEQGLTMLWVTHDLDTLPDACTRVLSMRNGRIVGDAAPRNMMLVPSASFPPVSSHCAALRGGDN